MLASCAEVGGWVVEGGVCVGGGVEKCSLNVKLLREERPVITPGWEKRVVFFFCFVFLRGYECSPG